MLDIATDVATVVAGVAAAGAAGFSAYALQTTRRDRALELAASLHARMDIVAWALPEGAEPPPEPGIWYSGDVVVTIKNDSQHPYYSVMASIAMQSRQRVWAARAEMIRPGETLMAVVGQADLGAGCDVVPMDDSTQVRTTYRDSVGKAWERRNDGRLRQVKPPKHREHYCICARPSESAALHRVREHAEGGLLKDDATGWEVNLATTKSPVPERPGQALPGFETREVTSEEFLQWVKEWERGVEGEQSSEPLDGSRE